MGRCGRADLGESSQAGRPVLLPPGGDGDVGTEASELEGDRPTQPGSPTGDEDDLTVEGAGGERVGSERRRFGQAHVRSSGGPMTAAG